MRLGHDAAAGGAGFRADLENPVGGLEHVEVVLDDDDAVAAFDQRVEHAEQAFHVMAVESGGRLIKQQQGAGGAGIPEISDR